MPQRGWRGDAAVPDAEVLFGAGQCLVIEFRGERYQLWKPRNGKLILTK